MGDRSKIIQLDERFPKTGEPTVQPVVLWGLRGKPCYEQLSKEASVSPAYEYIKHIEPVPGRTIVLVIGLGSYEFYGLNRNGDGFNEQPFKPGQSNGPGRDAWIMESECIQHHFQSYEQGHVFRHHVNKDPKKSIGRVLKAFWNPYMHRVEILEDIDNNKAPDLAEQIADGEFPAKSMGCFPAGTRITTRDGLCLIQDIEEGTWVLSHKGQWRKVTEVHQRAYHGQLYNIHTPTGDSSATSEHPYCVLPREAVEEHVKKKGYWRRKPLEQITIDHSDWRHAECLSTGDYLVTPFDTTVEDTLTVEQCALLGYYIAEGYIIFRYGEPYGVEFNHNREDAAVTELPTLLEHLVPSAQWHQRNRTNSDHAAHTYVYDADLALFCMQHAGQYANIKRLSAELLRQGREQQLALLGTWINGDGGKTPTGAFYVCSCNDVLMRHAQILGFRCGLYGRHHSITHQPSTIVDKVTTEYRVEFTRPGCDIIAPYTVKVAKRQMKGPSTGPFFIEGAVVSRITDISVLDFEGPVYNFEVEGDESYVAENHAVHNCRIKFDVCTECGNKAPTRKQYCDHLKWQMGYLDPKTGVKYGALNPSPRFFDSSWVIRPADRTGYLLKKVAMTYEVQGYSSSDLGELVDDLNNKSAAARKLAVIDKVVRGYPAAVVQSALPEAELIEKYRDTALPDIANNTAELSSKDLSTLAPYPLADTLASLSRSGIILTTPEFIQLFLEKAAPGIQIPRHILDRLTGLQAEIFELFGEHPSLLKQVAGSIGPCTGVNVNDAVKPLLEKRSTASDYLRRRLTPRMLRHDEAPTTDLLTVSDPNDPTNSYVTTRGAANAAQDALDETSLKRYLGAGTLMAGAYKTLATPGKRIFSLPLAGLGMFLGQSGAKKAPTYTTDTGEEIPTITELKKQGSVFDLVNTLGLEYNVTKTGAEVLKRAAWQLTENHPLRPFMQKASSFGFRHPALTLSRVITEQEKAASNGITEEQLDIEKVAEVIGTLALTIS